MEQELHPHIDEAVRDVRSSGASSWLSAFPLKEYNIAVIKLNLIVLYK